MVTVAWKKLCADYEEGGLGIKSLVCLNEATNMKLGWDMMQSDDQWANFLRSRVLRGSNCIKHNISSSLWSSIKNEFQTIINNSTWIIGDSQRINIWLDVWNEDTIANILNLTPEDCLDFPQKLSSFISNYQWSIPEQICTLYPNVRNLVNQVTIPVMNRSDKLAWNHNATGVLSLKEAYDFKKHHFPKLPWTKDIWSADIPPSRSLMVWRLMLDKMPTDENLTARGSHMPSMCYLCASHVESSFHLFFEFNYAVNIWCWLATILNSTLHLESKEDVWSLCKRNWNPRCKTVITSALVNIFNAIWFARNQKIFNDKSIHWKSSVTSIIANTSFAGNHSKSVPSSSITDFQILKKFQVNLNPPKAPKITEVIWHPPIFQWVKCNTDGSANNITSSCGGIFRNKDAEFLLCFAKKHWKRECLSG